MEKIYLRQQRVRCVKLLLPNRIARICACVIGACVMLSCAGNRHYHAIPAEGPPPTEQYVDLQREVSVSTLHFPTGTYTLKAEDDAGFYYRAPKSVLQHTGGAMIPRVGGIFVSKRDPRKFRGYVYLAGGLIHVGDFSRAKYERRDQ